MGKLQVFTMLHLLSFFVLIGKNQHIDYPVQSHSHSIALVKQRWHTGIVGDTTLLRCLAPLLQRIPPNARGVDCFSQHRQYSALLSFLPRFLSIWQCRNA